MAEMRTHEVGMTSAPLVRLPGKYAFNSAWKKVKFLFFHTV